MRTSLVQAAVEVLESRRLLIASDLDTSFDGDGKLLHDGGAGSGFTDVAVQADGKVLAVGQVSATVGAARSFGLFRFNVDGTPDPTFSGDGIAPLPFGTFGDTDSFETVLMADGRIVVAGAIDTPSGMRLGIARFTSTG